MHKAADNGHADTVDLLLQTGAALKVLDLSRQSPEALARANKHYRVLEVISAFHEAHDEIMGEIKTETFTS